jgi:hypothetical protein
MNGGVVPKCTGILGHKVRLAEEARARVRFRVPAVCGRPGSKNHRLGRRYATMSSARRTMSFARATFRTPVVLAMENSVQGTPRRTRDGLFKERAPPPHDAPDRRPRH